MIAKEHMRGLWEAFRCCCCLLLTLYVSLPFHFSFTTTFFTQLGISRRSMCIGACHAGTASWCDLRDPGWGDPGFRHHDLFAWHLPVILLSFVLVLLFQGWPAQDWAHKRPCHYVSSPPLDIPFPSVMFCFCLLGLGFFVFALLVCSCSACFVGRWFSVFCHGMVSSIHAQRTR